MFGAFSIASAVETTGTGAAAVTTPVKGEGKHMKAKGAKKHKKEAKKAKAVEATTPVAK